ncbi:MAG: glycosyltransferase family 4 protein, partial [Leptolyngbya sp.]|nr:glycosyltransferase family 4 protein [Leptolyngbya sp.]
PPQQGGIEHHCAEIYSRLAAQGHQVEVFARSSYNRLSGYTRYPYEGVQVTTLPSIPYRGVDAFCNAALAAVLASTQTFDIIHFHALGPALFTWVPRLLAPRSRIVVTCHGLDWQRAKWGQFSSRLIRLGEQVAVRCSHELAVVSQELQHYFGHTYCLEAEHISNGPAHYQDPDPTFAFGRAQGVTPGRYVLFLGRLVPEKRPDLLIQAFQRSAPQGWKLLLAGDTSDTSGYCRQLQHLAQGTPAIQFCGQLRGKRLAEIVRGAGLFVLPSDIEGLPLALLEAMREGIPVLASDIAAHRQLLMGDRGLLFRAGDVDSCATALQWAMHNPEALKPRAIRAQQYVQQHHSWDHIAAEWLGVYERLLRFAPMAHAPSAQYSAA